LTNDDRFHMKKRITELTAMQAKTQQDLNKAQEQITMMNARPTPPEASKIEFFTLCASKSVQCMQRCLELVTDLRLKVGTNALSEHSADARKSTLDALGSVLQGFHDAMVGLIL